MGGKSVFPYVIYVKTKDDRSGARRARVMIADDSAAIRSSLSSLISRIPGVEIVGLAPNGTAALNMIRTLKPDAVTLDIRMPEMNGLNVLEALKGEDLPRLIIVLTGLQEPEYRRRSLELGAKHFFHKATEFEHVIDILAKFARELNAE